MYQLVNWLVNLKIRSFHLSGCKKVQQALAKPGELERFVSSARDVERLRDVFAGLFTLDRDELASVAETNPEIVEQFGRVVARAQANPDEFVMKPQREGGGNNLYHSQISDALQTLSHAEQAAYILMERIFPPTQSSVLIRDGVATEVIENEFDF